MSQEQKTQTTDAESNETQTANVSSVPTAELRRRLRARVAWWFKLFAQPVLAIIAIIAVVFAFGVAQQYGWFTSPVQTAAETENAVEEVQYICPMVCVPPTTEPGKCPVCGMELKAKKASGDSKDKYGLRLDQASIRVANIRTVKAEAKPLIRKLRTLGQISYDEGSLATISAYVDGRIEKLFADYTGVRIDDGDELALLYSPDLYTSQVALLESLKLLNSSRSTSRRIDDSNRQLYESSRQRLIELGLTENQIQQLETEGTADSRIRIVSPIAGTVIEKMADKGQNIKTGQAIYRVADLSSVWLMLELLPQDAAKICFGQKVTTRIQSHPGQEFIGRVAFIDPTVDPKTQTVRVRVVIPNEKGLIRVGDFATASIDISASSPSDQKAAVYDPDLAGKWISPRHPHVISDGPGQCTECGMDLVPTSEFGFVSAPITEQNYVVVPRNSVLMAGRDSVVYVETEPGRFEFRVVEVGQIVGDSVSIISGVEPGEFVASSATFLVDSQFNMSGKPSLIDPARALPSMEPEIDTVNSAELMAVLSDLTKDEQAEVLKQKICPVTETALGSMGTPLPVDINGRRIWICCKGCEAGLLHNPDKYIATLEKAATDDAEEAIKINEAMAGLSNEDRELAEAQKFCPVANYALGSMGTPLKVDVDGQPVFICCNGCRDSLLKDPRKYLDILANGPQATDTESNELPQIQPLDDDLPVMVLPQMTAHESAIGGQNDDKEEEIAAAIASLSIVDQELVRRQKLCPVADFPLGGMGTPIKVDVNGQPVFICCEGCRGALLKEPAKYLAKLPKEPVK